MQQQNWGSRVAWFSRWTLRLVEFGAVQGVVQFLLAVVGLLIVHSLSKPEYALFAITNSMLSAFSFMADLGIGIGVRSIGGRVCADRHRFGQLVNTALVLRKRFALGSFSIFLPLAAWMLSHNGATLFQTILLCLSIAMGGAFSLGSSVWAVSPAL